MIYGDEQRLVVNGVGGRVICAANRPEDAPFPITTGHDRYGDFVRFETMTGDASANELLAYKKRPKEMPKRAMIALERLGNDESRRGRCITHHFWIVVEEGRQLNDMPFFTVLDQLNAAPLDGKNWRPPPMSLTMIARARKEVVKGRERNVKDASGKGVLDEFFRLDANVWNPEKAKPALGPWIRSRQPIVRGRRYEIKLAFVDGRGGDGMLQLWIDGESQGVYRGPTGYAGFGAPYPAYGVYQHVGQHSIAARFYGWRESVLAV